jgi:hypothetical protein
MAAELEIRDGDPWWLSPDVWTVPGDPEGTPGLPIAGQPTYMWARVRNKGSSPVNDATVRFYWANPAAGFDRTTAHVIGTAFVSLAPGEGADVLCLTPWTPEYVNDGHECVLAEAFHPSFDPLPATPDFQVPTDRHVAQRNLSVIMALTSYSFRFAMVFYNAQRVPRSFRIEGEQGRLEELRPLEKHLGRALQLPSEGKITRLGFTDDRCAGIEALDRGAKGGKGEPATQLQLDLPAYGSLAKTLVGEVKGGAALVHVRQIAAESLSGGLSILVLPPAEGSRKEAKP